MPEDIPRTCPKLCGSCCLSYPGCQKTDRQSPALALTSELKARINWRVGQNRHHVDRKLARQLFTVEGGTHFSLSSMPSLDIVNGCL